MMDSDSDGDTIVGQVKWFDPSKGFGFVVAEGANSDILLHANVLRNFGQGSVADGSVIELVVQQSTRGMQAIKVLRIDPPSGVVRSQLEDIDDSGVDDRDLPLLPARVKWFDKVKGFGFGNIFGDDEDIFIHVEVLRRSGFADLQPGEAICMKIVEGKRGRMASSIESWDSAS